MCGLGLPREKYRCGQQVYSSTGGYWGVLKVRTEAEWEPA